MASGSTSRHGATARTRSRSGGSRSVSSARSASSRPGTRARRTAAPSTPGRQARRPGRTARGGTGAPWFAPFAIVALIVVAAWSFYPVARIQYQEQREKARLESELAGLQERNERLRAEVDRLKTPEGVEQVARESLGLVKEGENVYVVLDGDETEATPTTRPQSAVSYQDDAAGWQRVLDVLFGVE